MNDSEEADRELHESNMLNYRPADFLRESTKGITKTDLPSKVCYNLNLISNTLQQCTLLGVVNRSYQLDISDV